MNTLGRLLEKIRSGGTFEVGALAAEFDTTPEMIEAMLEHMQRQGAVRTCGPTDAACSACSLGTTCGAKPGSQVRVWQSACDNTARGGQ
jgi:hypothetical protein